MISLNRGHPDFSPEMELLSTLGITPVQLGTALREISCNYTQFAMIESRLNIMGISLQVYKPHGKPSTVQIERRCWERAFCLAWDYDCRVYDEVAA